MPNPYLPDELAVTLEPEEREPDEPVNFAAWIDDTYCYDPERVVVLDDEERRRES